MNNPFYLQPPEVVQKAKEIRKKILKMNCGSGQGHTSADLSETDILASIYFRLLRFSAKDPDHPDRDRFILSKGHGVGGLYCTLAQAGLLDAALLNTYLQYDSKLPGHPVRQKTPYVEVNTGALGHGLAIGVGLALAAKKSSRNYRVFVLTGDGELQEGSNWEAAAAAARFHLDNLIWIVDRNRLQLADFTRNIIPIEPLDKKMTAFGFAAHHTDGNDPAAIIETIESLPQDDGIPKAVIAATTKGKGVSFIENQPSWHHRIPSKDELLSALEELA